MGLLPTGLALTRRVVEILSRQLKGDAEPSTSLAGARQILYMKFARKANSGGTMFYRPGSAIRPERQEDVFNRELSERHVCSDEAASMFDGEKYSLALLDGHT